MFNELEIEDVHVNANLRWSYEKQKHMQIIIQNYSDNIHKHQNQTKYYNYSFNTTRRPGKIDVDAKLHQTSKMY